MRGFQVRSLLLSLASCLVFLAWNTRPGTVALAEESGRFTRQMIKTGRAELWRSARQANEAERGEVARGLIDVASDPKRGAARVDAVELLAGIRDPAAIRWFAENLDLQVPLDVRGDAERARERPALNSLPALGWDVVPAVFAAADTRAFDEIGAIQIGDALKKVVGADVAAAILEARKSDAPTWAANRDLLLRATQRR